MPRLKGNSSHGSKPMTSLWRTLSWMPHCWPQKQQWVLTSFSGSSLVVPRTLAERCGPKARMISSSSTGIVAMSGALRPARALRQAEDGAAASRADLLVVAGAARELVAEAEVMLDGDEVADHRRGRVGGVAAGTARLLAARAGVLVEADAELRRTLEDVEELAERQPQEREDHRRGVQDGEERVGVAAHPGVADREEQAGHADGQEQDERQDVLGELLHGGGAVIDHAAAEREHHAGDDEERCPHEAVKDHEGHQRSDGERLRRHAEEERAVGVEVAGHALEVNPTPDEREGDGGGEQAAPHDAPVRQAAQTPATEDEAVAGELDDGAARELDHIRQREARRGERPPAAAPVHPRRRAS